MGLCLKVALRGRLCQSCAAAGSFQGSSGKSAGAGRRGGRGGGGGSHQDA